MSCVDNRNLNEERKIRRKTMKAIKTTANGY